MSNQELERRLTNSSLHIEDQQEIRRIFEILNDKRKLEIFEEWNQLVLKIKQQRERVEEERRVLFIGYLSNIENELEQHVRSSIKEKTHADLSQIHTNFS